VYLSSIGASLNVTVLFMLAYYFIGSIHTQFPTTHLQPMMQDSSHEWDFMCAPFNTVQRLIHTPSSITTSGPMVTLGPIRQLLPILALASWVTTKINHENK
jgi:hypothetical protein